MNFAPCVLYPADVKAIHDALLAAGHTELAETIRLKARRSRLDRMYAEHVTRGSDEKYDHGDDPILAHGTSGADVQVWRWVQKEEIRKMIRDKRNSNLRS
jgi:hypothetical protein